MAKHKKTIVQKSLFSWVFASDLKLQVLLLLIVIVAVLARVVPLEMQKRIVNEAIGQKNIDLLLLYCSVYLAAFVTASGLKFFINALESIIGQNTLAEMRRQLYEHILTLPQRFFRRTQSGLIVSSMTTELATAGDFIGMAVAVPLANILTLLAFATYLVWLDPLLAALSFSIYPAVLFLVPQLQKRVNHYNRKRVDASRSLAGRIGESVDGIREIKANAAFDIEKQALAERVDRLRKIRITWKLFRFAVKVVNNLFTNFSRFLIFALGGYLALKGRLELGALVAFLSAQEKLYVPWKELIRFYQAYQTAAVTYKRTMDYYDVDAEEMPQPASTEPVRLKGRIDAVDMSFRTAEGKKLLEGITFSLQPGEHMALVGSSGSGKSTLVHCLMGLHPLFEGRCELDGRRIQELGRRNLSANIGFVFQSPAIFSGSIRDNLLYACRAVWAAGGGLENRNPETGRDDDLPSVDEQIEALQQTGFFTDVLGFGLSARLNRRMHKHLWRAVLDVRSEFRARYARETEGDIEIYDENRFLRHSNVAENLLFGCAKDDRFTTAELPQNSIFTDFIRQSDLEAPLVELGVSFADRILAALDENSILPRSVPLSFENATALRQGMAGSDIRKPADLTESHRQMLLNLALHFVPSLHRRVDIADDLTQRILRCRPLLRTLLQEKAPGSVNFYRPDVYLEKSSIQDNILFGRITSEDPEVRTKINTFINRLLVEEELLEAILDIGLKFQVGRGGENLSGGQRQKLALARALLKKPSILLLDEATASLDNTSQDRIQKVLESRWKGQSTLVAVVHRLDIIRNYDRIAVMDSGRIKEMGRYEKLMESKGLLYRLMQSATSQR